MTIPKLSKIIGSILILLGLISYFGTGGESFTALIPSFFGLVFVGLGYLGDKNESMKKHAMHAAMLLAIFGLFGTFGGLMQVLGALGGGEIEASFAAAASQALMAILMIFFLILGVKSFIDARKQEPKAIREEEQGDMPED